MKFSLYNALWDESYKDYPLRLELDCIAAGGTWKNKDGQTCGLGRFEHLMRARALAWPKRYRHRWTDLMYQNFEDNDITILMGCACVRGDTRILNTITGESPTIKELCDSRVCPTVMTVSGPARASVPSKTAANLRRQQNISF